MNPQPPVNIGRMVSSDSLGTALHDSATGGNKKALRRVLERGIPVDYPNDEGQSALFCACYEGHDGIVNILLKHGANPNERCNDGYTPVHAACYSGNIKVLTKLIAAGGDLRLHDSMNRTPKDWALLQVDPKKKVRMLEFIEKARLFAMTRSGRDLLLEDNSSSFLERASDENNSVMQLIRQKIGLKRLPSFDQSKSLNSIGFGKVYLGGNVYAGILSTIPLVNENCLTHNDYGVTFDNGAFMVMESMTWGQTDVTVKRLHRHPEPGGVVDLLINENEYMGKLHHPSVLLLMGICQTSNLDGLVLIYEQIAIGSLYCYLHQQLERLSTQDVREILAQICDALVFLHHQDMVHCAITSHAINLVRPHVAKLGNFEYMVDSNDLDVTRKCCVSTNKYLNSMYNWMAPELMKDCNPTVHSDMYSFCCITLEMFENAVPWDMCDADTIRSFVLEDRQKLSVDRVPHMLQSSVSKGLELNPHKRAISFEHFRDMLKSLPQDNRKIGRKSSSDISKPKVARPKTSTLPGSFFSAKKASQKSTKQNFITLTREQTAKASKATKPVDNVNDNHLHSSPSDSTCNDDSSSIGYLSTNQVEFIHNDAKRAFFASQEHKATRHSENTASQARHGTRRNKGEVKRYTSPICRSPVSTSNSSSPVRFSYLTVGNPDVPACKPASHLTGVDGDTMGKPSSSGNLYDLYNAGTEDRRRSASLGSKKCHLPDSRDALAQFYYRRRFSESPERPPAELGDADSNWFAGRGSVNNLIKLWHRQMEDHQYNQAVLDGKLSEFLHDNNVASVEEENVEQLKEVFMKEVKAPEGGQSRYMEARQDAMDKLSDSLDETEVKEISDFTHISDMPVLESSNEGATDDETAQANATYEVTGKRSGDVVSNSSPESNVIEEWVSSELEKIKESISSERSFSLTESHNNAFIASSIAESDQPTDSDVTNKNPSPSDCEVEEFYFDDVIHPRLHHEGHMRLQTSSSVDMQPSRLSELRKKNQTQSQDRIRAGRQGYAYNVSDGRTGDFERHTFKNVRYADADKSKISRSHSKEGRFQTQVSVYSSLQNPGHHKIKHTTLDLVTGEMNTLREENVIGAKVISKISTITQ